jgi:hypothetical protein
MSSEPVVGIRQPHIDGRVVGGGNALDVEFLE